MILLEQSIKEWSEKFFPKRTTSIIFRKLCEEVGELGSALIDNTSVKDIRDEIGDVGILLIDLAGKLSEGKGTKKFATLELCIMEKFDVVKKRIYDKEGKRVEK